jgi:hypothetical protein
VQPDWSWGKQFHGEILAAYSTSLSEMTIRASQWVLIIVR